MPLKQRDTHPEDLYIYQLVQHLPHALGCEQSSEDHPSRPI